MSHGDEGEDGPERQLVAGARVQGAWRAWAGGWAGGGGREGRLWPRALQQAARGRREGEVGGRGRRRRRRGRARGIDPGRQDLLSPPPAPPGPPAGPGAPGPRLRERGFPAEALGAAGRRACRRGSRRSRGIPAAAPTPKGYRTGGAFGICLKRTARSRAAGGAPGRLSRRQSRHRRPSCRRSLV